jgi:hypothetical protein
VFEWCTAAEAEVGAFRQQIEIDCVVTERCGDVTRAAAATGGLGLRATARGAGGGERAVPLADFLHDRFVVSWVGFEIDDLFTHGFLQ